MILEISDFHAGYIRDANVLQGVDLSVRAGERLAIMGRNGMGKTLLVKSIMGLVRPSAGAIRFDGMAITGMPTHRISNLGVAYVPQGREIFADFTVLENLRLGIIGKPALRSESFDQVFEWFPILAERKSQRAGTMSGGQMQQLAIARALVGRPKLLLLDEPSEGIQPSIVHEIAVTLNRISADEALTVVVIEQNVEMVERLSERVLFLENGRIAEQANVHDLSEDPSVIERYLGV
ncbi:MAG: ABC-type high affinity urea uptake system ATPase component UrtE [Rhodobacteraceae bacterium HLUCCA12]|nr:MAG: ABC-type high affinity urea uptake system ATPase component UrtE [Rhodobacteraceae bacterium HLUCCA12]